MNAITYYTNKSEYISYISDFRSLVSAELSMSQQIEFDKIEFVFVNQFEDLTGYDDRFNIDSLSQLKEIFADLLEELDHTIADLFPIKFKEDFAENNNHFALIKYAEEYDDLFNLLSCYIVREEVYHDAYHVEFDFPNNPFEDYLDQIVDWLEDHSLTKAWQYSSETAENQVFIDFQLIHQ